MVMFITHDIITPSLHHHRPSTHKTKKWAALHDAKLKPRLNVFPGWNF